MLVFGFRVESLNSGHGVEGSGLRISGSRPTTIKVFVATEDWYNEKTWFCQPNYAGRCLLCVVTHVYFAPHPSQIPDLGWVKV